MTTNLKTKNVDAAKAINASKHQQVIDLLSRANGVYVQELSPLASWLTHSTRAFLTGLKKKGDAIASEKTDSVRRYRAMPVPSKSTVK